MSHRKVRLKVTFEVDYEVPADWDDEMTLFHVNESSFCVNNLLRAKLEEPGLDCACSPHDVELVRPT